MSINWEMGLMPNIGGNALAAFQQGRQRVVQERQQAEDRQWQMQEREATLAKRQTDAQAAQIAKVRETAIQTSRLADSVTDENSYQQARRLAANLQMDVSKMPPTYNPEWVQEQRMVSRFLAEKPEAASNFGKIATDKGFRPGTPEFAADVAAQVKAEAFKTVPMVPGGGVAGINTQTGEAQVLVKPYGYDAPTGTPAAPTPSEGAIAENKSTGQKLIFQGGKWQPMGGQPGGQPPFQP